MSDLFDRHVEANLGGGDNPVGQGDSYAHSSPLLFVKKAHLEEQDCDAVCSDVCKAWTNQKEREKSCIPHLKASYPKTLYEELGHYIRTITSALGAFWSNKFEE